MKKLMESGWPTFKLCAQETITSIYADIQDSSGWDSAPMLPAVKLYAKAHLLKDRQQYLKPVYSFRIYSEFFNNEFGIEDDGAYSVPIPTRMIQANCVCCGIPRWRITVSSDSTGCCYTIKPLRDASDFPSPKAFTNVMQDRPVDVTCRVGTSYSRETIAFHRKMITHKLQGYIQKDRFKTSPVFGRATAKQSVHFTIWLWRNVLPRF